MPDRLDLEGLDAHAHVLYRVGRPVAFSTYHLLRDGRYVGRRGRAAFAKTGNAATETPLGIASNEGCVPSKSTASQLA